MDETFTVAEFRAYLSDAKARLAPFRRSCPGVALYYDHRSAWKIHDAIKEARAALRNASEEAEFGVAYERGGSALNTAGGSYKFALNVRRCIEKHFAVLENAQDSS